LQTNWIAFSLSDSYARKFRTIRGFPSESKVVTLMFHPAGILGNMRRHGRRSMDLADFVSSSCCSRQALSRPDCRRVPEKYVSDSKNFFTPLPLAGKTGRGDGAARWAAHVEMCW
jgi:hypothetical protein